jgi:hypothetical protein
MPLDEPPDLIFRHMSRAGFPAIRQTLLDVYVDVYQDALSEPFTSLAEFNRRLGGYATAPGWECVLGIQGDETVGYAFGYTLQPKAGWWRGLLTEVPDGDLVETGKRTFALNEIMVRAPWRGTSVAQGIHDELMAGRREERATLLVEQTHPKVRKRYEQWGYTWLGAIRPEVPYAPVLDAMILPLRA